MKFKETYLTLVLLVTITLVASVSSALIFDPRKIITYLMMGLTFSLTSIIVYYRKMEFLASSATHTSLLAVITGLMLESLTGVQFPVWSLLIGLFIIYLAGVLIRKGLDPNNTSAVIVASTSAFSVIGGYLLITLFPVSYNLNSLFLGDPLLLSSRDVLLVTLVTVVVSIIFVFSIYEILSLGIDEVSVKLLGLKTEVYDILTYTIIGLTSIGLLRVSGYILQHVLILLPAITASFYSNSGKELILYSITLSLFSCSIGFLLSLYFNLSPTGLTGVVLVVFMVHGILRRWIK
ncbi:metal ABC transporter permease [Thermosphaera chiliense]|uniref:Metal ABC transporter permease n=1 Tax=Thermosphaera chiliense TaxID=3402707 RepID=A0A7M1URU5_9CREN|nr:metal ABC transporter permease [Thermosphaera aggregans]QOR94237.1 metal ABC transporter permease [Thermosphaera aggregans]